jgi:hypothetical protein
MRRTIFLVGALFFLGACGDSESADDLLLDCLEKADDTYDSCESDCADDPTCIDLCTTTWDADVESCCEDTPDTEIGCG